MEIGELAEGVRGSLSVKLISRGFLESDVLGDIAVRGEPVEPQRRPSTLRQAQGERVVVEHSLSILVIKGDRQIMSTPEPKANSPAIGTWRLISWEVKKADGRVYYPFGQDVAGYIGYTDNKRMSVFLRLHGKTSFYAGTYEVEGDKVVHHVLVSNTGRDGYDLVRFARFEGNRLILTTVEPPPRALVENPEPGDTSRLVWERVS